MLVHRQIVERVAGDQDAVASPSEQVPHGHPDDDDDECGEIQACEHQHEKNRHEKNAKRAERVGDSEHAIADHRCIVIGSALRLRHVRESIEAGRVQAGQAALLCQPWTPSSSFSALLPESACSPGSLRS